jgi:predicted SAM-dependent methyltransferase
MIRAWTWEELYFAESVSGVGVCGVLLASGGALRCAALRPLRA